MEYETRVEVESRILDTSQLPNGNYKPVDLCRELDELANWRYISSRSRLVVN